MQLVSRFGFTDIPNSDSLITSQLFEIRIFGQKIMQTAATIALQHHERWDGQGYPQGLHGEQIHLFARITKIADVFDALSHRRVYKEAWAIEKIIDMFIQAKNIEFDPVLLELFLENIEEFVHIKEEYPDED